MRVLNNNLNYLLVATILLIFPPVYATESAIGDANVQVSLNYPGVVTPDKQFVLASIVSASADQVSNITVSINCPDLQIQQNSFHIDNIAKDSTIGNDLNATVKEGVPDGTFVATIELDYFIKGFFDAHPVKHVVTQTTQFLAASKPSLVLDLKTPTDVFFGEPFHIGGTLVNQGASAHNILLSVYSPDIQFDGQKSLAITDLEAGKSTAFDLTVQTKKNLGDPITAAVHMNGTFDDNYGKTYPIDNSFSLFARQRGVLEIGDANGIWVGQFFIAPVVGVGTIVSSVIGFLIFIWHYKNKNRKRKVKRKT